MKIIDPKTGDFLLIDGITITKTTTYSELREKFPDCPYWEVGTGYFWLYFKDIQRDELLFYANLCFLGEALQFIAFGFWKTNEEAPTWENFEEKIELKRQKSYQKWLINHLGGSDFDWGKAYAHYSPKSSLSEMFLQYKKD
ncbi:hypothetical protein [Capnocytophaga sp.]|uniref:hypothetical protein n=1 Tax=Capnocytophaga sp. TaxID=44737 RepID=UPI0026DD1298|nr:hypothetical protein [Capnocytophaga sp.]MDO5105268.1 hypothetical protein [Capnocytophaga sp.]